LGWGTIAVTGFPGWLTGALFERLAAAPARTEGPDRVIFLTRPSAAEEAARSARSFGLQHRIVPFELEREGGAPPGFLAGADTVLHAAAIIHVRRTSDWYHINTRGTLRLAREAKRSGVKRFMFISSIAAAGRSEPGRPLTEADPSRPLHHYGRSKLLAERQLMEMHEPGRFEVVILRPAMFYGPPVPKRHADVYRRILHGMMPLVGGGRYERSLVHVDNLVQAVRLAMTSPSAAGNAYFIVDRPVYTTRAIVEAMAEALETKPRYLHLPGAAGEAAYQLDRVLGALGLYLPPLHLLGEAHWHQAASPAKAERELGYAPEVELREGMRGAVAWCRANKLLD
jgi:nucleoside-diphosphate-sugar epimerase